MFATEAHPSDLGFSLEGRDGYVGSPWHTRCFKIERYQLGEQFSRSAAMPVTRLCGGVEAGDVLSRLCCSW